VAFLLLLHLDVQAQIQQQNVSILSENNVPEKPSSETIAIDSTSNDSLPAKKVSPNAIDSKVDYIAKDSLCFNFELNKAYLYNESSVKYQNIDVKAAVIEVDFDKQELKAIPFTDSNGINIQEPHYSDGNQEFDAKELLYNFKSKKAKIKSIVTKQDDLFVHGRVVKKMPDDVMYIKRPLFTNCDLEHPHYYIVATRAKIIPQKKVITGGAMFFMNDVPTPLVLPFAMFPNVEKRTSGIIFPHYGESPRQGFYLRGGGFYWSINDYMDVKLTGDIYTRGDWKAIVDYNYRLRYKFSGGLSAEYGMIQSGDPLDKAYNQNYTLRVTWRHQQDPKASKNSNFNANVNFFNSKSREYQENLNNIAQNQSTSSISYSYNNLFGLFNFTTSASLNYNVTSHNIALNLPTISLTLKEPWYPLRRKNRKGDTKWWETLKFTYNLAAKNDLKGTDTNFFTTENFKNMSNGIRQNVMMSMDIKLFKKYVNWNISGNYHEYWYFNKDERVLFPTGSNNFSYLTHRKNGFFTARDFDFSTSMSTTLYGMLRIPKFFVKAIRHTMSPSISFSIRPNFETYMSGYRWYDNGTGTPVQYNVYDLSPNGKPTGKQAGSISISIGNTLEAKVRNKKDTVTGERKIKIIESFNISTSYNIFADSLNLSPLSLSARTTLFKKIAVNFRTSFNFYAKDSLGRYYNEWAWKKNKKLSWQEVENLTLSFSWRLSPRGGEAPKQRDPNNTPYYLQSPFSNNLQMLTDDIDFSIPWSLTFNYSFQYNKQYDIRVWQNLYLPPAGDNTVIVRDEHIKPYKTTITQVLNFSGDISITPKWKIAFTSGFDFSTYKLSTTAFEIRRDLHCWSLNIRWVPFGPHKEWSFAIRANSGMLSDVLKYEKQRSYLENGYQ
jgi:hypothetical protein